MQTSAWLILLFPLAGAIVNGLAYRGLSSKLVGWIGTLAIGAAFVASVATFIALQDRAEDARQVVYVAWNYADSVGVDGKLSILVDPLSVFMALVVTGVSTLIHMYSVAYLSGDRGYSRFFAYLNFFVFSMLLLVMAANFLILIIGWAFVGAASYLLISFWYRRTTATAAGIKAFVINVVGDVGLVIGTYFIFRHSHTLDFLATFDTAPRDFAGHQGALTAGLLLLLVGAFAKSAQVPLHTWLPDAMEGPTPVSALIHAATMVTAGVYLIARMHPLFELSSAAATVGAIIGCITLLVAGTIGLAVTDLKRVIAYSTMSQIGYMIMAVSAGAYVAGLFHLMTHAFFKALLFMAAGSVISAMGGEQSLNRISGFKRAMPFTYLAFIVGGLALSGVPPFSGFFSKDEILADIGSRGGGWWALYVAGYIGALLTAIYTWRMIFRAFWGDPCPEARELEEGHLHHAEQPFNPANGEIEDTDVGFPGPEHHIAERSGAMKGAMAALAVLAIIGGFLQVPWMSTGPREVPGPDVRRLAACTSIRATASRLRAAPRHHRSRVGGISIAYASGSCGPGRASAWRSASLRCTASSSTSGTSTRRSTPSSSARSRGPAASASRPSSASSSTALRRRADRDRPRRLGRGPRAADRVPARLRRAARARRRRRRPLLPHPEP